MTEDDVKIIKEQIAETIKVVVNGKIDRLREMVEEHNEKHERDMVDVKEHIEKTTPIIEAYNSVSIVGNGIKWIAGVGTAIGVLWLMASALWMK